MTPSLYDGGFYRRGNKPDRSFYGDAGRGGRALLLSATTALIARLPGAISEAEAWAANDVFKKLAAADALATLDLLYMPIGSDEGNNLINWISDTYPASTVNAPAYSGGGWTGDGEMKYFETGAPHNALANYSRDDAFFGIVCLSDLNSNTQLDAGFAAPTTYINPRSGASTMSVRSNSTSGTLATWTLPGTATSIGFSWSTRRSSTDVYAGRNAQVSSVFSQASAALGSSTFTMLRSGSTFSTRKDSALVAGGGITPAKGQAVGQIFVDYYATRGITL